MLASGAAYCAVQFVCQLGKNVWFGGARQIQILEPQNGESGWEPKCAQIYCSLNRKWLILSGPPESHFEASKWRIQAGSQIVFKSIVFWIENGWFWRRPPESDFEASKPQNRKFRLGVKMRSKYKLHWARQSMYSFAMCDFGINTSTHQHINTSTHHHINSSTHQCS